MSFRRHLAGPVLILAGLVVFLAPVAPYWLVGRGLVDDLGAPDGYEVADTHHRSLSLLWDAEGELATVTLHRIEAETTADRVAGDIQQWLLGSGFNSRFAHEGQWFDRERVDAYDYDQVRYELTGPGPQYDTVTLSATVFDTDGLFLIPLATTTVGVLLAFAGALIAIRSHHPRPDPEHAPGPVGVGAAPPPPASSPQLG